MIKRLDFFLIPILLVIVAMVQLYNSNFKNLSPWKGGGFGMFSTNKENMINAIGYFKNGDSILIEVKSNKLNIPISDNFLKTTLTFPREESLQKLGTLVLNSYLKPEKLIISRNQVDGKTFTIINSNKTFYNTIYMPKYYMNKKTVAIDSAIRIDKIKIILSEVNFHEENYTYKKEIKKQLMISK
jgi:hypothetical protein